MLAALRATARSAPALAGIMIGVVDFWLALEARRQGLELWPDLVTGLSAASLYTGTLAAGFAAHAASGWEHANRERVALSARRSTTVRLVHVAGVIGPMLAGFALSVGALQLYATVTAAYGRPAIPWLLALGGALVAAAAFGYLLGAVGRGQWFVAPVAAIAFYAMYLLVSLLHLPYALRALFPVVSTIDTVFSSYVVATMLGQLVFFLGVAAMLIGLSDLGRGAAHRLPLVALVVPVAAVALGASGVIANHATYTLGYNPPDYVCRRGELELCLNRGYSPALGPAYSRMAALNARVRGTPLEPRRLQQTEEGGAGPARGARDIHLESASAEDIAGAAAVYVEEYGGVRQCAVAGESGQLEVDVGSWVAGDAIDARGMPDEAAIARLQHLSPEAGNAWFRAHYDGFRTCSLTLADLP